MNFSLKTIFLATLILALFLGAIQFQVVTANFQINKIYVERYDATTILYDFRYTCRINGETDKNGLQIPVTNLGIVNNEIQEGDEISVTFLTNRWSEIDLQTQAMYRFLKTELLRTKEESQRKEVEALIELLELERVEIAR